MRAKCIQDCFDSVKCWSYKVDGGTDRDGFYDDIDPLSPIATYFEFPAGTKKYHKVFETVIEGEEIPEVETEPIKRPQFTVKELRAKLDALGIKWIPVMNKEALMSLLLAAENK